MESSEPKRVVIDPANNEASYWYVTGEVRKLGCSHEALAVLYDRALLTFGPPRIFGGKFIFEEIIR